MKKILLASTCLIMAVPALALQISNVDFVKRTMAQINFAEFAQNSVWPGFHPAATSSIIVFSDRFTAYALNYHPVDLPWQKLDGFGVPVYLLNNSYKFIPDALKHNDDQFLDIENQNTFVDVEYPPEFACQEELWNKFMTMRAMRFFDFEAPLDQANFAKLNIAYDSFNDATLVKLLYLEDAALTMAQQKDAARAEAALRDAVAIHQYRQQQSSTLAVEYENAAEIFHSIPYYIALASLQLNDHDFRKMSQRVGCRPLSAMQTAIDYADCAINHFPTYAGEVYARALDNKQLGNWKEPLLSQFKSISQVAVEYYQFSQSEAQLMATQAMQKPEYHYARISRLIDNAMGEYLQKLATAKTNYAQMPGFECRFPIAWGLDLAERASLANAGLDQISAYYRITAGTTLLEDLHFEDSFASPKFKFDHFPYVSVQVAMKKWGIDKDNSWTVMRLSNDAKFLVDGESIPLPKLISQKTVKNYKTLIIVDAKLYLVTKYPGKLDTSSGSLKLFEDAPVTSNQSNTWANRV